MKYLWALLIVLVPMQSMATTAVCQNATGHAYGQRGQEGEGKRIDFADSMKTDTFIFSWSTAEKPASVTISDSRIKRNNSQLAAIVSQTAEQISFAVGDPTTTWLYSIFPKSSVALISRHETDAMSKGGGAIATSFLATCVISE
jgi:hypothetical protein